MASEPREYKGEVLDQELANEKNKRFNKSVIRGFKRIPGVTSVGRTSEFPRINLKLKREVTAEDIRKAGDAHALEVTKEDSGSWVRPNHPQKQPSPWAIKIGHGTHPKVKIHYFYTEQPTLDHDKAHNFLTELSKTSKKARVVDVARKMRQDAGRWLEKKVAKKK